MPRKLRELKAQITREGFVYLPKRGKGSHERWRHPLPIYLEKQVLQLLTELKKLEEDEES
jgi:predicted RNA binding protein YcfA (HicA-like mRNA interferase family)